MPNLPEDNAILTVFKAISNSELLSQKLILKGGNALAMVFSGVRASVDLDFTDSQSYAKVSRSILQKAMEEISKELQVSLNNVRPNSKFAQLVIQRSIVKPPKKEKPTYPSIEITIGYSLKEGKEPPFSDIVKLDISLNDLICENIIHQVDGKNLKVSSINDIIAEKLRALIQQKTRDRNRPNDVFDIWFFHSRLEHLLDVKKISSFLLLKSENKLNIELIKKSIYLKEGEIYERAKVDYEKIEERISGIKFPSFDEAYSHVLTLVNKLDIPN